MKKNFNLMALASFALSTMALTACGGGNVSAAKTKGVYLSPSVMSYQNMRPTYNYYLTTFTQEELTLFDDDSFCLIVSSSTFSALVISEDNNDFSGNERTNYMHKYYGEYTAVVNDIDEDLLDVTLKSVKRVVTSYDQSYWLDTDNWNDEMGKKVIPPAGYDQTTGAPIVDENAEPWTAKQYLDSKQFAAPVELSLNQKTYSFDFVNLQFAEAK